jgi:nucleotide-binding universal stress UspA family protein
MLDRILYATDFSENSERAFPHAWRLAAMHDAELLILHVYDVPTFWQYPDTPDPLEIEREAVEESVKRLREMYARHAGHGKVGFAAAGGVSVHGAILNEAVTKGAGLVVVGTRGASGVKEALIGSIAMALVRESQVPVLAVPEGASSPSFEKLLYASDLQEEDADVIERLVALTAPMGTRIAVAHVAVPGEMGSESRMEGLLRDLRSRMPHVFFETDTRFSDDLSGTIDDILGKGGFDMLAMLEKERVSLLDRLFHRDLVRRMEFHSRLPILSFNARSGR